VNQENTKTQRYRMEDLLYLMQRLRDPETGCPWDRRQTFETIVPFTLEEAYEVADTIERQDYAHLKDELGDLLFQVVFYAQMGKEQALFDFDDVPDSIVRKLLRRHPHVFPDGTLDSLIAKGEVISEETIKANWERIKKQERAAKEAEGVSPRTPSILDDVPNGLPSLSRAEKLQKRASLEGFDWDAIAPVFDKIQEELDEVREVLQVETDPEQRRLRLQDEMGDVLFACVNLARFLQVNSESALRHTNLKFERRFRQVEALVAARGKSLREMTLADLDGLWNEVKQREKAG
jgi:nucleoside triphosphate diphosphatase